MKFYKNPKWIKMELGLAVAFIVIGGVSFALIGGGGFQIGLGALLLILHFTFSSKPLIQLHDDYLEMKVAPLAAKHLIRYKDIKQVVHESPKKVLLLANQKGVSQKIRLPFGVMTKDDVQKFLKDIESRMQRTGA